MIQKARILVVSNDAIMRRCLEENLSKVDYQVISTQNSGEGLKAVLDEVLPDLIILDVMMPGLEGIEVSLRVRRWCEVPLMMLSAWGTEGSKVRGLDLSSDSYLSEAFGMAELNSRISKSLQRRYAVLSCFSDTHSGASIDGPPDS